MTKIYADPQWEYKFVEKEACEFQKLLNQWKHEFEISIIHIGFEIGTQTLKSYINALIARRPKE